jgi:cytochrome c
VEVKDDKGAVTRSNAIPVYAGNETPDVKITLTTPSTFFFPGKPIAYKVNVSDKEDGTTANGSIDTKAVNVKMDYVSGPDKAQVVGHQIVSALTEGKNMAFSLDCKTCHKQDEKSIGPAFSLVSAKYKDKKDAKDYLVRKVIAGGGGVWGETAMAAHPNLKAEDAGRIVDWILSLAKPQTASTMAAEGKIVPTAKDAASGKTLQISASYTDKGGNGAKPLTGEDLLTLRSPAMDFMDNDSLDKFSTMEAMGMHIAVPSGDAGWIRFNDISMKDVTGVTVRYGMQEALLKGYVIELRADKPDGELLGKGNIPAGGKPMGMNAISFPVRSSGDQKRKLYVVMKKADPGETKMAALTGITFTAR